MKRFGEILTPPEMEAKEKHTPHIDIPEKVKAGEPFEVTITVGKEVPHPNTIEHHIKWVQVFAEIEGRPNNPVHIATFDLGPTFAEPQVSFKIKLEKNAILYVLGYCNLHGVWENSIEINVE